MAGGAAAALALAPGAATAQHSSGGARASLPSSSGAARAALLQALPGLPIPLSFGAAPRAEGVDAVAGGVAVFAVWRAEGVVALADEDAGEGGGAETEGEGKAGEDAREDAAPVQRLAAVVAVPGTVSIRPLAPAPRAADAAPGGKPQLGLFLTGPPALASPAVRAALLSQLQALCRPLLPAQRAEMRCGELAAGGALPARALALLARAAPTPRDLAGVSRAHAAQAFLLPPSVSSDGGGGYFGALGEPLTHHPRAEQLFIMHCLRADALAAAWNAARERCEAAAELEGVGGDGLVAWPMPADAAALLAREAEAEALAGAVIAVDEEGEPLTELPTGWATPLAALLPRSLTLAWPAQARRVHAWRMAAHAMPRDVSALLPL